MDETRMAAGRAAKGPMMTTQTKTAIRDTAIPTLTAVVTVAALGLFLMVVAGHAQSATLHDAAHDMRHATGFPCH
jgi:cobalt transporter subunit CbtB